MTTTDQHAQSGPKYIEEPAVATWFFGSNRAAWLWLIARLWLGWEWFQAGWGKVFGGNITIQFWNWGDEHSFTGDGDIGWVTSGGDVGVGDAVAGFADGAIQAAQGPHPDIAYGWYIDFLEWVRDTAHPWIGPTVAIGELAIGTLLILGLFTGIAAALGAVLNFSFVFAGSSGVNPAMILVSFLLILAWRNAGWYGLDRWALPLFGTPWSRGRLRSRRARTEHAAAAAPIDDVPTTASDERPAMPDEPPPTAAGDERPAAPSGERPTMPQAGGQRETTPGDRPTMPPDAP